MTTSIDRPRLTYLTQEALEPFKQAVVQKDEEGTRQVLQKLFGIDAPFHYDMVPLIQEVYVKFKEVMAAYSNELRPLVSSPVHFAAALGSKELFQITNEALLNEKDAKGLTPLHYAIAANQQGAVLYLIKYSDLTYVTEAGDSYLHYAAKTGSRELLNAFLKLGLDAGLGNVHGLTPAHFWVHASDDMTGLRRLVRQGAPLYSETELSPIAIQILKIMEKNPAPATSDDYYLLACNLVRAGLAGALLTLAKTTPWMNTLKFWPLYSIHVLSGVVQHSQLEKIAPAHSTLKQLVGTEAYVQSLVGGFIPWLLGGKGSNIPAGCIAAASTAAVAEHAFQSMAQSKYASWTQTLLSVPVHFLNTAASLLDCYIAYSPLDSDDSLEDVSRITGSFSDDAIVNGQANLSSKSFPKYKNQALRVLNIAAPPFGTLAKDYEDYYCEEAQKGFANVLEHQICDEAAYIHAKAAFEFLCLSPEKNLSMNIKDIHS